MIRSSLVAALLFATTALCAPVLYSTRPTLLVADKAPYTNVIPLDLYGNGLALPTTTGATFDRDVQVWARWADSRVHSPDNNWHLANDRWFKVNGWLPTQLGVSFMGLDQPGWLQLAVCVAGQCAFTNVQVRAHATSIPIFWNTSSLTAKTLPTTVSQYDFRRLVRFTAVNLNDWNSTHVWLRSPYCDGVTGLADLAPGDNTGEFWLPVEMQAHPGTYSVWVGNDVGWSNWAPLTITP